MSESASAEITRELERDLQRVCSALDLPIADPHKRDAARMAMVRAALEVLAPSSAPTALPDEAPELYAERPMIDGRREGIIGFLRRVWKPWMDADLLSRADLRRIDPQAEKAIENWVLRNGELPADINLLVYVRTLCKPASLRALSETAPTP